MGFGSAHSSAGTGAGQRDRSGLPGPRKRASGIWRDRSGDRRHGTRGLLKRQGPRFAVGPANALSVRAIICRDLHAAGAAGRPRFRDSQAAAGAARDSAVVDATAAAGGSRAAVGSAAAGGSRAAVGSAAAAGSRAGYGTAVVAEGETPVAVAGT